MELTNYSYYCIKITKMENILHLINNIIIIIKKLIGKAFSLKKVNVFNQKDFVFRRVALNLSSA